MSGKQLAEAVAKALGTSLRHYMPTTQAEAVKAAEHVLEPYGGLLAAIEPFVITKSGDEFTTITVRSSAIEIARAAIAKAEGR